MLADGGDPRAITPPSLAAFAPDWTPDGEYILVTSNCCQPSNVIFEIRPDAGPA
jgi:Tol biopolymer transport system component